MIETKSPLKDSSNSANRNSNPNSLKKESLNDSAKKQVNLQDNFKKFRQNKLKSEKVSVGSAIFEENPQEAKSRMRVFIGQGNNCKMVEEIFKSLNFRIMPSQLKTSTTYDFKWVQCNHELDFNSFIPGSQIACHFRNNMIFTSKNGIQNVMNDVKAKLQAMGKDVDFQPKSWRIDKPEDAKALLEMKEIDDSQFIVKPFGCNQGKGIKIIFHPDFLKKKYFGSQLISDSEDYNYSKNLNEKCEYWSHRPKIVQQQIKYPLLVNNKKFDQRCYMLIVRTNPMLVLFKQGQLRLSMEDYTLDTPESYPEQLFEDVQKATTLVNIQDEKEEYKTWWESKGKFIHLTNASIQKKHPQFKQRNNESILKFDALLKYFNKETLDNSVDKIKWVCKLVCKSIKDKLVAPEGTQELLGMDFMQDKQGNPYLLEMNMNPALFCDTDVQTQVIPPMMKETVGIVLNENKKMFPDKWGSVNFEQVQGKDFDYEKAGWHVVIDEANSKECKDF